MAVPITTENLEEVTKLIKAGLGLILEGNARRVDVADNIIIYKVGDNMVKVDIKK